MPYFPSPGRCIYCGSTDNLSDEHIIPQALGGRYVLALASCEVCRKKTHQFETRVARDMYWPLRIRLGVRGSRKHRKERPTHWPGVLVNGQKAEALKVEAGKFPILYYVFELPEPGILLGEPPTNTNPPLQISLVGDDSHVRALVEEYGADSLQFSATMYWGDFCRQIAKICHAYAVSQFGLDAIEYCLPPVILGDAPGLGHLVGGAKKEETLPPGTDLGLALFELNGATYIGGMTTILGPGRFPVYKAVVGRVKDKDLEAIRLKMA
jgi:hypothetical protein